MMALPRRCTHRAFIMSPLPSRFLRPLSWEFRCHFSGIISPAPLDSCLYQVPRSTGIGTDLGTEEAVTDQGRDRCFPEAGAQTSSFRDLRRNKLSTFLSPVSAHRPGPPEDSATTAPALALVLARLRTRVQGQVIPNDRSGPRVWDTN